MFWCPLIPDQSACKPEALIAKADFLTGLFLVNWQKLHVSQFRCVRTSVAGAAVAAEGSGLAQGSWVDQCGGLGSLSGG